MVDFLTLGTLLLALCARKSIAKTEVMFNKNHQKAISTGLPIFLGGRVAAHTQATGVFADHCVI